MFATPRRPDREIDELERLRAELAEAREALVTQRAELDATRRAWSAALEEAERRGELAIATAELGTFEWDPRSPKVRVSPMFVRLAGLEHKGPPRFDTWANAIHPEDRTRVLDEIKGSLHLDRPFETTYRIVWDDGSIHWHTSRAKVLRDATGAPVRVVGVVLDVTERRRMEEHLQRAERLATLGELAASIAHEINNPLAYVLNNLEVAGAELAPDAPAAAAIADALDGARRVGEIVRSLGLMARPQAEAIAPIDVGGVISAVERLARAEIARRARLELVVPAGLPLAMGQATQLGQVLMNLLVNAAQAMPDRPTADNLVSVDVRAQHGTLAITVRDNGGGIAPEVLPKIFDPFFTTKPSGVGTGLGLALSHRFITAMRGTIIVSSEVGVGTTFVVTLPTVVAEVPASSAAPARVRVLLVDDDATLRRAIGRLLAAHDVVAVDGGRAALALVRGGASFDVILCDVSMPGMTGPELVATLAAERPGLAARVIYMSGNASDLDGEHGLVVPPLEKPFQRAALAAAIAQLLALR